MADLGVRWVALLLGVASLLLGACGKEQGGDGPQTGGAEMSGTAGSSGAPTGGNGGVPGGNGMSTAGASGERTGADGAGGVGGANSSGAGGVVGAGGGNSSGAGGAAGDGGTAGNGGTATGGTASVTDCKPGTGFLGQLTGPGSPVPNGGIFTTDPSSVDYGDANLAGVIAAYPAGDELQPINVDVHDVVITATAGATPGPAVSAARTTFWIADKNALLEVQLDPSLGPSCCPNFDLRSGMRISFKATEVSTFIKLGLITAASNFVAGTQGNCVLVSEPTNIAHVDFYQMVRVSAKLTTDPDGGGGAFAFTSWHLGLSDAIIDDFMSDDPTLHKGQTITFVGPVSPYVGYQMLVESNDDWVKAQN